MRTWLGALLLVVTMVTTPAVSAFDFEPPEPPEGGSPQVINGAEVTDPSRWPATFIFRSPGGSCTATAVGEQVIITAAHCIEDEATGTVRVDDSPVSVQCFHHPDYPVNATTDFALCLAETEMTGIPFESVSSAIAYPRINDTVVILGYGCTTAGGHDRNFGVLFEGAASVIRTPSGADIDTITRGGAAVCFGDSGGAAYYNLTSNGNRRALVAINSRGDISRVSFLSSTATPQFVQWALDWAGERNVVICGLHVNAAGCR